MDDLPLAGQEQPPRAHASVLIIDGDPAQREAALALLRQHGFRALGSPSASDALAQLARGVLPDVIVVDLLLPEIDGWEFRARLLGEPAWAQIPLVALSGDASAKARAIHAAAFLAKPVDDALLVETVERVLQIADGAFASASERREQGPLSAGIAHEVNNSLAYVLGTLELAETKARELEGRLRGAEAFSMVGLRQLISRAQRGADRIAVAVRELERPKRASEARTLLEPSNARGGWGDAMYARERTPLSGETPFLRKSKPRRSVLVVDDEAMICELVNDLLEEEYDVMSFTDPRAALATILSGSFDVIVCDLLMPELTGMDLYEQLAKQRPELTQRLIFLSGGGFTDVCREFLARVRRPQVKKPFHNFELLDAIEEQLTPKH